MPISTGLLVSRRELYAFMFFFGVAAVCLPLAVLSPARPTTIRVISSHFAFEFIEGPDFLPMSALDVPTMLVSSFGAVAYDSNKCHTGQEGNGQEASEVVPADQMSSLLVSGGTLNEIKIGRGAVSMEVGPEAESTLAIGLSTDSAVLGVAMPAGATAVCRGCAQAGSDTPRLGAVAFECKAQSLLRATARPDGGFLRLALDVLRPITFRTRGMSIRQVRFDGDVVTGRQMSAVREVSVTFQDVRSAAATYRPGAFISIREDHVWEVQSLEVRPEGIDVVLTGFTNDMQIDGRTVVPPYLTAGDDTVSALWAYVDVVVTVGTAMLAAYTWLLLPRGRADA